MQDERRGFLCLRRCYFNTIWLFFDYNDPIRSFGKKHIKGV